MILANLFPYREDGTATRLGEARAAFPSYGCRAEKIAVPVREQAGAWIGAVALPRECIERRNLSARCQLEDGAAAIAAAARAAVTGSPVEVALLVLQQSRGRVGAVTGALEPVEHRQGPVRRKLEDRAAAGETSADGAAIYGRAVEIVL